MGLSRRDLLRTAAAAAVAAALPACSSRRGRRNEGRIEGRIVGGSDARGHLLRPGGTPPPVASREDVPVVVVGGGIAGLSAAWKLARSGFADFVLLEMEDALGGTATSGENAVSRYPWAAHYVPIPTREQRTLCQLLLETGAIRGFDAAGRALPDEDFVVRDPEERLFFRGEWSEGLYLRAGASAEDLRQLDRFQAETAALAARRDADGRRAFAIPIERSARDEDLLALDRISMADWMASKGLDSPRLRWVLEYACRDDFGCLLEATSAWAGLHYFAARVAVPGDEPEAFLTWPEGNGFLVRHLAEAVGGRARSGAVVLAVEPAGDRVLVRYADAPAGVSREIVARRVVCALPRFAARRVVRGLEREAGGFRYSPWVVANLTLSDRPVERGFPLCWDNVLYESDSLGYVVATHQSDRAERSSVWTWYRPFCDSDVAASRERCLATPWEGWRDAVLSDLVRAHRDIADHVERLDVWRWGHAMVRPEPGFVWGEARRRAAAPLGLVHFAGADVGGLPLFEEAQWAGVRAAEEVLTALERPFESSL